MAAPLKPWESQANGNGNGNGHGVSSGTGPSTGTVTGAAGHNNGSFFNATWSGLHAASEATANSNPQTAAPSPPPPLPPRPDQALGGGMYGSRYGGGIGAMGAMSPYGSGYSSAYCSPGMYGTGYGSYGGYSGGHGGYSGGYGMSRYGSGYEGGYQSEESDFVRLADESSRQAFQSIESIVQAFGSVSTMLESTYFAVHSSFRAVLGVADHLSRLRSHLAHIISTLAVIRTLNWFYRRLLYLVGMSQNNPNDDAIWSEASSRAASGNSDPLTPEGILEALTRDDASRGRSSWPILIFFAVVCGTPWLIWKLLARVSGNKPPASNKWLSGQDDHYVATALYDFRSDNPREVAFKAGQQITVAPKGKVYPLVLSYLHQVFCATEFQPRVRGWLLATVDGQKDGLIPANYVRILGFRSLKQTVNGNESTLS